MDKKQQLKIPKFVWVLAAILVISIIFLIAVQMPFSKKIDKYNKDHVSAESQISQYEYYLTNAETITAAVEKTEAEASKQNEKLSVKPDKTIDDIRDLLQKHDMDLTTLSISDGVPDSQGGVSATGDPLFEVTLTYNFTATEKKLIETLDFFERESQGAYFVTNINISKQEERAVNADGDVSVVSTTPASQLYNTTLTIKLYYFNEELNTGETEAPAEESSEEAAE